VDPIDKIIIYICIPPLNEEIYKYDNNILNYKAMSKQTRHYIYIHDMGEKRELIRIKYLIGV